MATKNEILLELKAAKEAVRNAKSFNMRQSSLARLKEATQAGISKMLQSNTLEEKHELYQAIRGAEILLGVDARSKESSTPEPIQPPSVIKKMATTPPVMESNPNKITDWKREKSEIKHTDYLTPISKATKAFVTEGIKEGIKAGWPDLKEAAKGFGRALVSCMKVLKNVVVGHDVGKLIDINKNFIKGMRESKDKASVKQKYREEGKEYISKSSKAAWTELKDAALNVGKGLLALSKSILKGVFVGVSKGTQAAAGSISEYKRELNQIKHKDKTESRAIESPKPT